MKNIFERGNLDFPLYNEDSFFNLTNIIVMVVSIIFFTVLTFINLNYFSIVLFASSFIVILFLTRGKLNLVYKKIKLSDFKIIILSLVAYLIYSIISAIIFTMIEVPVPMMSAVSGDFDALSVLLSLILQILGEENVRFIVFILLLTLIYKYTNNRKLSVSISIILSCTYFGLLHYTTYGHIIFAINLIIPFIFISLTYVKTKNLLVSFIAHFLADTLLSII